MWKEKQSTAISSDRKIEKKRNFKIKLDNKEKRRKGIESLRVGAALQRVCAVCVLWNFIVPSQIVVKYFLMAVIFSLMFPLCTSDTRRSFALFPPNRVHNCPHSSSAICPSQHSLSLPLPLIWSNYLIIPALSGFCLFFLVNASILSIIFPSISVSPSLKVTVQLQIVRANQEPLYAWWQQRGGGQRPVPVLLGFPTLQGNRSS